MYYLWHSKQLSPWLSSKLFPPKVRILKWRTQRHWLRFYETSYFTRPTWVHLEKKTINSSRDRSFLLSLIEWIQNCCAFSCTLFSKLQGLVAMSNVICMNSCLNHFKLWDICVPTIHAPNAFKFKGQQWQGVVPLWSCRNAALVLLTDWGKIFRQLYPLILTNDLLCCDYQRSLGDWEFDHYRVLQGLTGSPFKGPRSMEVCTIHEVEQNRKLEDYCKEFNADLFWV